VLNHTAGLQNALSNDFKSDPLLMCNWDESLKKLAEATPESLPGEKQVYHAFSFGWLCGGIIEVPPLNFLHLFSLQDVESGVIYLQMCLLLILRNYLVD
jgi:hypothetical protein